MFWRIKFMLPLAILGLGITGSALAATGNISGMNAGGSGSMRNPVAAVTTPATTSTAPANPTMTIPDPAPVSPAAADPGMQQRREAMIQAVQSGAWQQMYNAGMTYWNGDWQQMQADMQDQWDSRWQQMYDASLGYWNSMHGNGNTGPAQPAPASNNGDPGTYVPMGGGSSSSTAMMGGTGSSGGGTGSSGGGSGSSGTRGGGMMGR